MPLSGWVRVRVREMARVAVAVVVAVVAVDPKTPSIYINRLTGVAGG